MFDAEDIATGDLADFARRHIVLSRNCENSGKFCGIDGYDGASAAFVEEGVFGAREIVNDMNSRTERRSTGLKTGHYRGEAGFSEGDGEAAVGNVVSGWHGAFGGESDEAIDEAFFGGEVDGGRFAGDDGGDGFGVFGGVEFAGGDDGWI
jgi:hypothetical protein